LSVFPLYFNEAWPQKTWYFVSYIFPLHSNKRIETIYFTSFENEDFHNLEMFIILITRLLIPSKAKGLLLEWCVGYLIYFCYEHIFEYYRKVKRFCVKYIYYRFLKQIITEKSYSVLPSVVIIFYSFYLFLFLSLQSIKFV